MYGMIGMRKIEGWIAVIVYEGYVRCDGVVKDEVAVFDPWHSGAISGLTLIGGKMLDEWI